MISRASPWILAIWSVGLVGASSGHAAVDLFIDPPTVVVSPGQQREFSFSVRAGNIPDPGLGTFGFQISLVCEGAAVAGGTNVIPDFTSAGSIVVTAPLNIGPSSRVPAGPFFQINSGLGDLITTAAGGGSVPAGVLCLLNSGFVADATGASGQYACGIVRNVTPPPTPRTGDGAVADFVGVVGANVPTGTTCEIRIADVPDNPEPGLLRPFGSDEPFEVNVSGGVLIVGEDLCAGVVCPENDPCVQDLCNPSTGTCEPEPAESECEVDGDLCTLETCDGEGSCIVVDEVTCSEDVCVQDQCNPATGVCDPEPAATPCVTDGNLCTTQQCDGNGECAVTGSVTCAEDPCIQDLCNPLSGACEPEPATTGCSTDDDLCTTQQCNGSGACVVSETVTCPNDPCVRDQCNPGTGICDPEPATTGCSTDDDLCTTQQCNGSGACVVSETVTCPSDSCIRDQCNPGTGSCDPEPATTPCDTDQNLCTRQECNGSGTCSIVETVSCPNDPCVQDQCNPGSGACDPEAATTACETDSDLCTTQQCDGSGSCAVVDTVSCPNDPCVQDQCNPGTGSCDPEPAQTSCDTDGTLCTRQECDGIGTCAVVETVTCPDSPCIEDQCNPGTGVCDPEPSTTVCATDEDLCTSQRCDGAGSCGVAETVTCPDDPCLADQCDPGTGTCAPEPVTTPCATDSNLCTRQQCDGSGLCAVVDTVSCPADQCIQDQCNPESGVCEPEPATTDCDTDGDLCTRQRCDGAGICATFENVTCPDDPCVQDQCNPGSGVCEPEPATTTCTTDDDLCTAQRCDGSGLCDVVETVTCPEDQCIRDQCNPQTGTCDPESHTIPCDADSSLCTNDHCDGSGACSPGESVTCPDDPCVQDQCNPLTGTCEPEAPATPCETDTDLCTTQTCDGSGICAVTDTIMCPIDECVQDQCNPESGGCDPEPEGFPCNTDADECTMDECDGAGTCELVSEIPECRPEICDNGIDDDQDGDVDGDDSDCQGEAVCNDLIDNDEDDRFDCDDEDCPACPLVVKPCPGLGCRNQIAFHRSDGLDRFVLHLGLPATGVNPANVPLAMLITNANGVVFAQQLPAGDLRAIGHRFQFRNDSTRFTGGLRRVTVRRKGPALSRIDIIGYGDLSAATIAQMTVQIRLGAVQHATTNLWTRRVNGWTLNLPDATP